MPLLLLCMLGPLAAQPTRERETVRDICAEFTSAGRLDLVGDGLWLPEVARRPGVMGAVFLAHETPWPGLFSVEVFSAEGEAVPWTAEAHQWSPAGISASFSGDGLRLTQRVAITPHDVAAARLTLTNSSGRERALYVVVTAEVGDASPMPGAEGSVTGTARALLTPPGLRPLQVELAFCLRGEGLVASPDDGALHAGMTLGRGGSMELAVALALRPTAEEAAVQAQSVLRAGDPVAACATRINEWYAAQVPAFTCSDAGLERAYAYRALLLRRNTIRPARAVPGHPYRHACVFEGRSSGWLARLSARSLPVQILEARWLREPELAKGIAWTTIERRQGETEGGWGFGEGEWITMALWRLHLVHPDRALLAGAYPGATRQLRSRLDTRADRDQDGRPEVRGSFSIGLEYSPSFLYFTTPRWDHTQTEEFGLPTSLERIDEQCYLHLNAIAASCIARELGKDADADSLEKLASLVREATLAAMWSAEDRFFYSIEPTTHAQARVREWTGFLPFLAAVATPSHIGALEYLDQPDEFATPWRVPTVARSCPAFSPGNTWIAGPNASPERPYAAAPAWNGSVHPLATGLVADAVAMACRMMEHDEGLEVLFSDLLKSYTDLHFVAHGDAEPLIVQAYNPLTGAPLDGSFDHLRSQFIDLIIRHVCGLQPRPDELLVIDPIDVGLTSFAVRGVRYRGHDLDVLWDRVAGGLRVVVDGKEVARQAGLQPAVQVALQ